jgi:hypothetical protein
LHAVTGTLPFFGFGTAVVQDAPAAEDVADEFDMVNKADELIALKI